MIDRRVSLPELLSNLFSKARSPLSLQVFLCFALEEIPVGSEGRQRSSPGGRGSLNGSKKRTERQWRLFESPTSARARLLRRSEALASSCYGQHRLV